MRRNRKIFKLLANPVPTLLAMFLLLILPVGGQSHAQETNPTSLSGFDSSEIFDIRDGGEFGDNDKVLLRMLYRVCQVSDNNLLKYSKFTSGVTLDEVRSSPRDFRCYVFELTGRIAMVRSLAGQDEDQNSVFSGFHLARFIDDSGTECVIALPAIRDSLQPPSIPPRWPIGQEIDQAVSIRGFFIAVRNFQNEGAANNRLGLNLQNPEALLFVARKVEWYPSSTSQGVEVSESELLLAKRGVDIGRLETVRTNIGSNIGKHESASFYQILAATLQLDKFEFPNQNPVFTDYLQDPVAYQATTIRITGNVRRATKILITDKNIQRKLGSDHYYQLDLLAPLNNQKIVIKAPDSDSREKDIEIENRFPVVVCTVSLPVSESEILRQQVNVTGFFFKLWNYDSELTDSSESGVRQIAPLVIGLTPEIIPIPPDYFGRAVAAAGSLVLIGLVVLFWCMRSQKGRSKMRLNRELPDQIEIPDSGQH